MEINAHLNDAEMAEALLNPGRGLVAHLDVCDSCRMEVGRLRRALDAESLKAAPPEDFWQQQRTRIWQRITTQQQAPARRTPNFAWAALAAMVALGSLWVSDSPKPVAPKPAQSQIQIDDEELMMAVEHAVQSNVPEALEPASLLAQEITQNRGTHSNSQARQRETLDEN
jgi:hypothetical protein